MFILFDPVTNLDEAHSWLPKHVIKAFWTYFSMLIKSNQVLICSWTRNRKKWRPSLKLATKEILFSFITWNFRRFLVRSKFVCGFALVLPESWGLNSRQNQSMSVSTWGHNPLIVRHFSSIFEPSHFSFGWGMDNANDLGFVVFVGVDKCLFLFNLGSICKEEKRVVNQQS